MRTLWANPISAKTILSPRDIGTAQAICIQRALAPNKVSEEYIQLCLLPHHHLTWAHHHCQLLLLVQLTYLDWRQLGQSVRYKVRPWPIPDLSFPAQGKALPPWARHPRPSKVNSVLQRAVTVAPREERVY